ncbi:S-methyl-5-thioribose-1-phosphate isomerase [PVC group bacterium]|nr:S-methyl-5-thioribose-1-phosphate isomerase [PVC group bacterium]
MRVNIKTVEAIRWSKRGIKILDQTQLPHLCRYRTCRNVKQVYQAIKSLQVRGAPLIGIAAAMGVALGASQSRAKTFEKFYQEILKNIKVLAASRPTAVNLFWALDRMKRAVLDHKHLSLSKLKQRLCLEAKMILNEDRQMCASMAEHGARLVKSKDRILTHCNTGALATGGCGTALGVIYKACSQGKKIEVFVDETRPLLQGGRLTAWELMRAKIGVTVICDNMVAHVMKVKKIHKVFVGADRIAANGDTANKIGTYGIALLCKSLKIPFYVVAPSSTFDLSISSGKKIPIEERPHEEIYNGFGKQTAPCHVSFYNPAFDVTPRHLITAIITEKGIIKGPSQKRIARLLK